MDNYQEVKHCIALTLIPGIGLATAKKLLEFSGTAVKVFENLDYFVQNDLLKPSFVEEIRKPIHFEKAESIIENANQYGIKLITHDAVDYPSRLKECVDAPFLLYYKGNLDLNQRRVINVVGTRNITSYGVSFVNKLIQDIASYDKNILVVSGMAYGVDIAAHSASLREGLNTVGVLAHGLDRIYPSAHKKYAVQMVEQGGLLTEFPRGTDPEKYNFVSRNRIIAGISDATIVVESAIKGGALLTADFAGDYNRECFAVPGRVDDEFSKGCNRIIKEEKARILTSFEDLVTCLNWDVVKKKRKPEAVQQVMMPLDISDEELIILKTLADKGTCSIDELELHTQIEVSVLHTLLFTLEMNGHIQAMAGNAYKKL